MVCCSVASAAIEAQFIEGAPKDEFVIWNSGPCPISDASLLIDLSSSNGQLIFDVSEHGGGVEVYQPFELTDGEQALGELPIVQDGQNQLQLKITHLAAGARIAFTIDVDDTIGQREITVSGAEIEGATLSISSESFRAVGAFSSDSYTALEAPEC